MKNKAANELIKIAKSLISEDDSFKTLSDMYAKADLNILQDITKEIETVRNKIHETKSLPRSFSSKFITDIGRITEELRDMMNKVQTQIDSKRK